MHAQVIVLKDAWFIFSFCRAWVLASDVAAKVDE